MKMSFSRKNSHKNPIFVCVGILAVLAIIFVFTTCDIGLGQIVNTEKPVINTAGENPPGAFLHGENNIITLDIKNELGFEIRVVFMDVEYYSVTDGELKQRQIQGQKNPDTGEWFVNLDVSDMIDGKIKPTVTAIDESGNKTTTTEMVYIVKNMLPQIKLYIPSVAENDFDNKNYLDSLVLSDPIYQGLDIMGLATDEAGIAEGFPKIMFWPDTLVGKDEDGLPLMNSDGSPVNAQFGHWRTVVLPATYKTGAAATKFSWPFAELIADNSNPTGYRLPNNAFEFVSLPVNSKYRFRIWIRDSFGNDNFFPNRTDNKRDDGKPADPDTAERKYIEVTYKAIGDVPMVQVPTPPRYYNRAGDFIVDFTVTGTVFDPNKLVNPDTVLANITNTNTGSDITAYNPEPYIAEYKYNVNNGKSPYTFKLTITADQAASWGAGPSGKEVFLALTPKYGDNEYGVTKYEYFILDETPPEIVIDQPTILDNKIAEGKITGGHYSILYPPKKETVDSRPKWVTAKVITGGRNTDANGIEKVYYHLGKIDAPISDEKMSDDKDREDFYNDDVIWTDTKVGTSNVMPNWSGSVYSWTYTYTYDRNVNYKTTSPYKDIIQELSDLDTTKLGNPTNTDDDYGTDGKARFYLPLYVKVVDFAGNSQIIHYKLSIDPELDDPQTNFIYPENKPSDPPTVGGTVRLSGTAEDNTWIHKVLLRIHKDGKPANEYYVPTTTPVSTLFFGSDGMLNPTYPKPKKGGVTTTAGWFEATVIGNGAVVSWTCPVNQEGGLNPGNNADIVNVTIEAVAIDSASANGVTGGLAGPIETMTVKFSSKVPRIEEVKVSSNGASASGGIVTGAKLVRDYYDGMSAAGKFIISMEISAQDGINSILAKINNSMPVTIRANGAPQTIDGNVWSISEPAEVDSKRYKATMTVTIDSTGPNPIVSGIGWGKTGVMNMEITVEDSTTTHFSTTNSFRIGIDNYFPNAKIETPNVASDDPATSKYFQVQGTAQDWGGNSPIEIQGLERMLVYFEKAKIEYSGTNNTVRTITGNGTMLDPKTGLTISSGAGTNFQSWVVMDTAKAGWTESMTIPNAQEGFVIPTFSYDDGKYISPSAMVIDYGENNPTDDWDGDGTYGEGWNGLTDKTWQARMMISRRTSPHTQQFSDGPYIVHYIIMDKAGNATHYQKDIYVANNKPLITGINVGTDIDFNNILTYPDEYRTNAFIIDVDSEARNTQVVPSDTFKIRNNRFGLKLNLQKGNGQKNVSVTHVAQSTNMIPVTNLEIGRVYQIAATHTNTDFTKYGAPNGYANTVFVATGKSEYPKNINGTDNTDPTAVGRVYSFTQTGTATKLFSNVGTGTVAPEILFDQFTGVSDNAASYFIVKVYDTAFTASTLNGSPHTEYDQLASAVLLTVNVNNTDSTDPTINVTDFGQKWIIPAGVDYLNDGSKQITEVANAVYSDYAKHDANGKKEGYVQYQAHSNPTTTANISGKVIFNGKVADNHYIDRITVAIPGYNGGSGAGTAFNIATRNIDTGRLEAANTLAGEREFGIVYPELAATLQFSLAYGQTLTWTFTWDSSKIATTAANDVGIVFTVYDRGNRTATMTKRVNIVPYILEVETPLSKAYAASPSAFNRSAQGGYPVSEGDEITIRGFNLGAAVGNAKIGTTALTGGSATTTNGITTINSTVPTGATSGELVVTVNNIDSFNNRSNKTKTGNFFTTPYAYTAPYNWEPNGVNNNILNNSRYIYVWQAGMIDNASVSSVYNPFMRVTSTGVRLLSYGYYPAASQGRLRVNRNGNSYQVATSSQNRMTNTTVGIPSAASGATLNTSWYAIGSDITAGDNYPFKFGRSAADGTAVTSSTTSATITPASINIVGGIGPNSNRFKIPRIAVQSTNTTGTTVRTDANADRILISYFDETDKNIYVIYGNTGDGANSSNIPGTATSVASDDDTGKSGSMFTAAGFLSNGLPLIAWYDRINDNLLFSWGNGTPTTTGYQGTTVAINNNGAAGNAYNNQTVNTVTGVTAPASRLFTATAAHGFTIGEAILAAGNLRYVLPVSNTTFQIYEGYTTTGTTHTFTTAAYASGTNATPAINKLTSRVHTTHAQWQSNAVIIDTNKGAHVDMAVDANDNVHLAYFDLNNGGLYYAIIEPTGTGAARRPNTGTAQNPAFKPVKVDTFLSAGTKIMINVRSDGTRPVPYITYAHASFAGTKNSVRVAWRTDFTTTQPLAGSDANDAFSSKWEVMTVPVRKGSTPQSDEFICNGVPTAQTWTAPGTVANGYLAYNTRLDQTVIVGFFTDKAYEGAILKGNILTVPTPLQK